MAPYAAATDTLEFYATAQPMTAVRESQALDGLPGDPGGLASVVRGALVHRDWAPLMGLQLPAERIADQHIRPVTEMIERILALWTAPLCETREPERRMVGVCRHFAVLHVSLLRRIGIPARARAGFAGYFGPGWADHWITEWWDGRWVRYDTQISSEANAALNLDFDPADQPAGKFLTGAEAWLQCRAGGADPQEFGIFDQRGLWFVFGDLMLDLAAINGIELLPWDGLGGAVGAGPAWQPDDAELREVDRLAEAICADRFADIRSEYRRRPVPRTISSFNGAPSPVDMSPYLTP